MIYELVSNADKLAVSNNAVVSRVDTNNFKSISVNVALSFFIGASIMGQCSRTMFDQNSQTTLSVKLSQSAPRLTDVYCQTIDLLKLENEEKLSKMQAFEENWDGNGAKAFSKEAINLFRSVIETLCKQPKIAPTGNNSLLMQFEKDDKSLLAFDLSLSGTDMAMIPQGNFNLAEEDFFTDKMSDRINSAVRKFYGFE